jgi:hypothetical protein
MDTDIRQLQGAAVQAMKSGLWWLRAGAIAAVILLAAVAAPLVWSAVAAGMGLLALAVIVAAGFVVIQAVPWLMQRLENRLLRARKNEARQNPIEQLQNDCLRREQRLQSFHKALVTIGGQIQSMREMVEERRHLDPSHVLDKQGAALKRMTHFYECNLTRLGEAHSALEAFRHKVQQKMFEWEFAQAGETVLAKLNPSELAGLVQDLLSDEALRSVQARFNSVFAELDLEMHASHAPTRSMLDGSELQQLGALRLPELVHARSAS